MTLTIHLPDGIDRVGVKMTHFGISVGVSFPKRHAGHHHKGQAQADITGQRRDCRRSAGRRYAEERAGLYGLIEQSRRTWRNLALAVQQRAVKITYV